MGFSYWERSFLTRVSRRRGLAVAGAASLGAVLMAACGSDKAPSGASAGGSDLLTRTADTSKDARRGGLLKLSATADVPHFDPHALTAPLSRLTPMMYSRLLQIRAGRLGPPDGTVDPDAAESFEYAPDKTQLTFKLRPNLYFHNLEPVNGRLVDAEDVVFSYKRTAEVGILRSSLVNAVNPAAPIVSVTAPDARTVVIKTSKPLVYVDELLSNHRGLGIIPREAGSAYDPRRTPIGSGAFMLSKYEPSVRLEYARHDRHYDQPRPYVDRLSLPIIPEYASGLSQFRAGQMYWYSELRAPDLLPMKRDLPALEMHALDVTTNAQETLFGQLPGPDGRKSPFLDERVRQAYSMAIDRGLWIEVVYDTKGFAQEGLQVETRWNTAVPGDTYQGWWLDPKGKDFGPNASYYQHDVAEAKKLLAAAGYASGVELQSHVVSSGLGVDFAKWVEILEGFVAEAGFHTTPHLIDYNTDYVPNYRDSSGRFSGISYRSLNASPVTSAVGQLLDYRSGAFRWYGFDADGKGDFSGDPYVDDTVDKALAEFDVGRRRGLVFDTQKYLAKKSYGLRHPGGASNFDLVWPAVRNFNVFREPSQDLRVRATTWWLDPANPPLA